MKRTPSRDRLVLVAFLLILLAFGLLLARKYLLSTPSAPVPAPVAGPVEPRQLREVVLYFASPEGAYLVAEGRQIEDCLEESDCLRATVQALVDGPVGDLLAVFPAHAQLRDVRQEEGTATVDFSRELLSGHPGGSLSELLTVYSLADTLAESFPHIRQVRILVDGEPVDTLKGHVDLRQPVTADFTFTRPPEGAASGAERGEPAAAPAGRNEQ